MSEFNVLDMFCGAGGFSCGFEKNGLNVEYGVDNSEKALKTYDKNHKSESIEYDIRNSVPEEIKSEYDVIIGSPPCKGFSDARGSRHISDDRNGLVFEYISWISELQPKIAIMENVAGIRTISDDFTDGLKKEFKEIGYNDFCLNQVDSSNYGVPQSRERVFIAATNNSNNINADDILELDICDTNITVEQAIKDLPEPRSEKPVQYSNVDMHTEYSKFVRDLEDSNIENHEAKTPNKDISKYIIDRLEPGEMYRSNRFGDRYRQIWDILSDKFSHIENSCFEFISNKRSKKEYRIKGKTVGHVNAEKIKQELDFSSKDIENTLLDLESDGWLRKDEVNNTIGYDINTKSGVRPKYMRLQPDSHSNTILTTDFKPRDKVHPYKNRGLSLREGARIQSFPDSFEFKGSFNDIASQIGNAVPPLISYKISDNVKRYI
jgi:DNA (cytosine-5)-methyltransferase 1